MEFSFSRQEAQPFKFSRIDLYLYKFTSPNGITYKVDFKPTNFQLSLISYAEYEVYNIVVSFRAVSFKQSDANLNLTFLHIIRNFLNNQITVDAMLVFNNEILSKDIFELRSKINYNEFPFLNERSTLYLIRSKDIKE